MNKKYYYLNKMNKKELKKITRKRFFSGFFVGMVLALALYFLLKLLELMKFIE
jgi:heme/copper-type cytochrome/quinol oxidase subunit 1